MGWQWLIDFTTRVTTGPRTTIGPGDVVLQYVSAVGEIYGPLLGCLSNDLNTDRSDPYTFSLIRQCPHAKAIAHEIGVSCQFTPCHCSDITCDANQLYCKLFAATYKFCRQYAHVTGIKCGMSSVSLRFSIFLCLQPIGFSNILNPMDLGSTAQVYQSGDQRFLGDPP